MVIALIAIAPNARAEIASKAYVDVRDKYIISGTTDISGRDFDDALNTLENNGGLVGIAASANQFEYEKEYIPTIQQGTENALVVTDDEGNVQLATGGYITNDKVSSSANIELGKLQFPTPPASCSTKGCMLMFYNNQYVWESVTRDTNETIATTGAVSATATQTQTNSINIRPLTCNGGDWDGTRCK